MIENPEQRGMFPSQPNATKPPPPPPAAPQKWPPSSNARRYKERHLWTRRAIESALPYFERGTAVVLWLISTSGTIQFVFVLLREINVAWWSAFAWAMAFGVVGQALLTFLQFAYANERPAVAWGSRIIDTSLSAAGWVWLLPLMTLILDLVAPTDMAYYLSCALLIGLAAFAAWYPENVAVKEE